MPGRPTASRRPQRVASAARARAAPAEREADRKRRRAPSPGSASNRATSSARRRGVGTSARCRAARAPAALTAPERQRRFCLHPSAARTWPNRASESRYRGLPQHGLADARRPDQDERRRATFHLGEERPDLAELIVPSHQPDGHTRPRVCIILHSGASRFPCIRVGRAGCCLTRHSGLMTNVLICTLSTEDLHESTDRQEAYCRSYVEARGWTVLM